MDESPSQRRPSPASLRYAGEETELRAVAIEPLAHFLAGLEERHVFLIDLHVGAGARITAGARRALLHRERAEPAQFDAVAARHGGDDLAQDGIDDILDV